MLAHEKSKGMGEQEEGMDLADEIDMGGKVVAIRRLCPGVTLFDKNATAQPEGHDG